MTIFNVGSINADFVYRVANIPAPGETLAARAMQKGLGGKGANMSVAAALAGSQVAHIGAVGPDGAWAVDRLRKSGVDVTAVAMVETPTAHAIINVDDQGENAIVIYPGANQELCEATVRKALNRARAGNWLVLQNETNLQAFSAKLGCDLGLRVAYAAAPFDAKAVAAVLPFVDFLILNELEAEQLRAATERSPMELPVADVVVTLGAQGCRHYDTKAQIMRRFAAAKVTPVDSTGAGDTFTGYLLAGLDRGLQMSAAIDLASRAAGLMVTRLGTADVIPSLAEVQAAGFD